MNPLISALVLGSIMGLYSFGMPYVVTEFFPGWMTLVGILGGLAVPVAVLWPARFDNPEDRWPRRLGRRTLVIAAAAVIGAMAAFVSISLMPGYFTWADRAHRQGLERQGKSEAEIVAALAAHRQTPVDMLIGGFVVTAMTGTVATGLTMAIAGRRSKRRRAPRRSPADGLA